MITKGIKEIGSYIFVIGKTTGHLYQSEFFREVIKIMDGPPPEINLFNEKNNGLVIQRLVSEKLIKSAHDISSGGILLALTEMCIEGKIGAKIEIPQSKISPHEYLFGEDQSRYLIEISEKNKSKVCNILKENSIFYEIIGKTQKKDSLDIDKEFSENLTDLYQLNSSWFKNYFGEH